MEETVPGDWTIDEHLQHGLKAIATLDEVLPSEIEEPRVCWHLAPFVRSDDEEWGTDASYCKLAKQRFDHFSSDFDVDYVGGLSGIEAWQYVMPSREWLAETLPKIASVAEHSNLSLEGWSFEPRKGPWLSISPSVAVHNGNTLGKIPADATTFRSIRNWLKAKLG